MHKILVELGTELVVGTVVERTVDPSINTKVMQAGFARLGVIGAQPYALGCTLVDLSIRGTASPDVSERAGFSAMQSD